MSADIQLKPFGPHVIIQPISARGSRYARRHMREFLYSNGVFAASSAEQGKRLGETLKRSRLRWEVR